MRVPSLLVVGLWLSSALQAACLWSPYIDLTARSNGYRRGVGVQGFAPVWQGESQLLFGQALAGRYWDVWSVELGAGYRRCFGESLAAGANLFLDLARTDHREFYTQVGIGGEIIGPCWNVRANGYWPFARHRTVNSRRDTTLSAVGNFLQCNHRDHLKREFLYRGFDVEGSWGHDLGCGALWGTIGYFYFDASGACEVQGPRLRLEYRLDNPLGWGGAVASFGGEYEYNRVNKNYGAIVISLRIPLGGPSCGAAACSQGSLLRQMGDRVRRNEAIFVRTLERCALSTELALARNGQPALIHFAAPEGSVGARGTLSDPTKLDEAVKRASVDDVLYVLEGEHGVDQTLTMEPGQYLLGSGVGHQTRWGRLLPQADSCEAIIKWCGGRHGSLVELANEVHVEGLHLVGTEGATLLQGRELQGVHIRDNVMSNGACGMSLAEARGIEVVGNTLSELGQGLRVDGLHGASRVLDNDFVSVSGHAIEVHQTGLAASLSVRDNRMDRSGGLSFDVERGDFELGLFHNQLSAVSGTGIEVVRSGAGDGRLQLRAMNNELSQVAGTGIHAITRGESKGDEPVLAFDIWKNRISKAEGVGIQVEHRGAQVGQVMEGLVRGNTLTDVGSDKGAIRVDAQMKDKGRLVVGVVANRIEREEKGGEASGPAVAARGHFYSNGNLDVHIRGNVDRGEASQGVAYVVETETLFGGTLHFDLEGNTSDRTDASMFVHQTGGTMASKSSAFAIQGANPGLKLDQEGIFEIATGPPEQPGWPKESK